MELNKIYNEDCLMELDLEIEENNTNETVLFHGGGILSFGNRITVRK